MFIRPFSIEDKSKSKKCNLPNILLKHFTLASSIDAKVPKITKAKVKNHHLTASNILLQILSSIWGPTFYFQLFEAKVKSETKVAFHQSECRRTTKTNDECRKITVIAA
jgi:hypothetical protein